MQSLLRSVQQIMKAGFARAAKVWSDGLRCGMTERVNDFETVAFGL